jgi:Zn-dependent protease with chaperone function
MKIIDYISQYFARIKEYIETEIDLVKLKMTQRVGGVLGIVFSGFFMITLFHITVVFIGVWVGLIFSEALESTIKGFGITVLFYVVWLVVSLVFSKQLLVRPLSKIITSAMLDQEEEEKLRENEAEEK